MSPPTRRPGRSSHLIAAIAAVGVLAIGTMGSGAAVAAPTAASDTGSQTPDVAAIAGDLARQQLAWESCDFDGDPPLAGIDISNVTCATIRVPQDWHHPDPAKTWDLRISQAKNIDATDPRYNTTLLLHPGGPTPGLSLAATTQHGTPDLRPTTNFVSFDQRGEGQSSQVECEYQFDPTSEVSEDETIAKTCSKDPQVRSLTSEQTAYDMDFIRHLLGLQTVSYLGYSYGTWLGTWYGSLFGKNIDRLVFDSALDPTQKSTQANMNLQFTGFDRQFRLHMMNYIARNDAAYGLGSDPKSIWERYFSATSSPAQAEAARLLWLSPPRVLLAFSFNNDVYPFAAAAVKQLITDGEAATPTPEQNPATAAKRMLDRIDPAVIGRSVFDQASATLNALAATPTLDQQRKLAPPSSAVETRVYNSTVNSVYCNDGQWTQGAEFWNSYNAKTRVTSPFMAQLGRLDSPPLCAWWPSNLIMPIAGKDFPETIVVQSELDALTPWESGHGAGTELPNTSLIAVDNAGDHGVFPYGTEAVDRPVIDFLLGGDRPTKTIVADALPLPGETSVFESWAPLDSDANHEDPVFTDPTLPAGRATSNSANGVDAILPKLTDDQQIRATVRDIYGSRGESAIGLVPVATR
jgi:pimeloyl-ACP methyl ester carboxylesterase